MDAMANSVRGRVTRPLVYEELHRARLDRTQYTSGPEDVLPLGIAYSMQTAWSLQRRIEAECGDLRRSFLRMHPISSLVA